ncbi:MAG: universal stress protein [Christiangramia sp.]|uniref:universal stress protein n=1 Tax=Christiangramia sp. TaxID=1931228 RepID=UPI0032427D98
MNVLILTDFSEVSSNAARYAVDFLQDTEANFYFLNIQDFDFKRSSLKNLDRKLIEILHKLEQSAAELKAYSTSPRHHFNTILSSENLISAVRKALTEKKIDLIFIGAISHKVHHHPILGDHAYEVVRKIRCNILAIPANCTYRFPEKVLLPIDHSVQQEEEIPTIISQNSFLHLSDFTVLKLKENQRSLVLISNPQQTETSVVEENQGDFSEEWFGEIQQDYDLIFIIGKNLSICDRFLHYKHGITANIDLHLPIFVFHNPR